MAKSIPNPLGKSRFYWTLPEARVDRIIKTYPEKLIKKILAKTDRNIEIFIECVQNQKSFVQLGKQYNLDSSTVQDIVYSIYNTTSNKSEFFRDTLWYERKRLDHLKCLTEEYK